MIAKNNYKQFLLLALYIAAMAAVMYNGWRESHSIRGGGSPLYRNLMDNPASIRRGFDPAQLRQIPAVSGGEWVRFAGTSLSVIFAPLPDMPQRPFMYPWGWPDEEFTIIIPVEMDDNALSFLNDNPLVMPGLYFNILGENWEIYFNGALVNSQWYPDGTGHIEKRRIWWDVYFPMDRSLIAQGTNVLALRIAGDPTCVATGIILNEHHYLDDYAIIKKRMDNYPLMAFCAISAFAGVYYLLIFLSVRNRREIYYLYFSIFSLMLSIFSFRMHPVVNELIPNSVYLHMGYTPLFLMFPAFCMFIETIGRGKVTKVTWGYLAFCVVQLVVRLPFSPQFSEDTILFWNITSPLYLSYVFFYDIVYFYFWDSSGPRKRGNKADTSLLYILISFTFVYACEIFQIVDMYLFNRYYSLREYSTFIAQIGMTFILAQRFSRMYRQLEQSNVMLETKVKERTVELEEQTAIAVQANRAKSDFLATMSHEIRTPLNAVIGLSEIELQGKMYDKTYGKMSDISRNNIAQIHQSGSYLLGIINDILDISKIEAGSFELVPVVYETPSLIGDTINLNRVRIGSKPISFVLEIGPDFPCKLLGDELRVKQILNNLLSNAAKYTHEGTITLSVEYKNLTTEDTEFHGGYSHQELRVSPCPPWLIIRFTVRDTGIGIRSEDMGKLFTNYTQLDAGANRKTEGTGLGLAITKKLVEMMGGSISVESEYGKGSVFTVEIVQGIEDTQSIGEETAANLRSFSYIDGRKTENIMRHEIPHKKALVVDDIPANLLVMRGFLAPYGVQVDDASSGNEAIEKVKRNHYDIIFMDHMMPAMDGVEAASAMRTINGFNTPIVAMTANALRGMKNFYLAHGFSDYLSKPINPMALDEVIKKLIPDNDPTPYDAEMFAQRLDMLNHYRVSFANIREEDYHEKFDTEYFAQFTALIESLEPQCGNAALPLIEAGRREDIPTIRETLPAFYETLRWQWKEQEAGTAERETERGILRETLPRLKKAIEDGQIEWAEAIMAELGSANLTPSGRELYFKLYDLLLAEETEKALEAIEGAL